MAPVSILLNLLWILIGGAWMAVGWLIAAVIMAITIIGLPWARAAFNIAVYTLLPFGSKAVSRDEVTGMSDIGTGPLGVIGNIIWFLLAGWWLALGHLLTALAPRDHHHRHSLRLGPFEAGGHRALADRQGDRAGVEAWTRQCRPPAAERKSPGFG
ncbi:hypothetical protein ACVWZZ_007154 [Bradyrhizobium sp. LM6.10]